MNATERGFREEFKFLSNFQYLETPMNYDGMRFMTNEHFYIAMKTLDKEARLAVSNHPLKGLKKFGRDLTIREDWDDIKISVMDYGLKYKFGEHNPSLRKKLKDTEDIELIEYNWWNDTFWGKSLKTNEGENNLGRLLMKIRDTL